MGSPETLVVLTNWRRPKNVTRIARAIRDQSAPCRLVIVDNSTPAQRDQFGLDRDAAMLADSVWRISGNLGPPCRWAPAMMEYHCRYVLFLDDDLLPGRRAVEFLLKTAAMLGDRFSTLGQVGRIFSGESYVRKNVAPYITPLPVDMTARAHLVLASAVCIAQKFRAEIFMRRPDASSLGLEWNDDLLLCLGIQRTSGLSSYICAACETDQSVKTKNLRDNDAVNRRPGHAESRGGLIAAAIQMGWKSLV